MKISVTKNDRTTHARLQGAMDISSARKDKETLLPLLESCDRLEVDLGVEELDTAGIQLLLLWRRQASLSGVEWVVGKTSDAAAEALAVYHLDLGTSLPGPRKDSDDGR
jgi:anti-anti-sigma regulatory factor